MYYDDLLKNFLSNDSRPSLQVPSTIGESTYASDSFSMIVLPNKLLANTYLKHEKAPDFQRVIEKVALFPKPIVLRDSDVFKILEQCPKVPRTDDCEECGGEGNVFCDSCMYSHTCEECNGSGLKEVRGEFVHSDFSPIIQLGSAWFAPSIFYKLEITAATLMCDEIEWIGGKGTEAANLFKIGDAMVALMPRTGKDPDDRVIQFPIDPILNPLEPCDI